MKDSKTTAAPRGRQHIIKRPRLIRLLDESTARIIMLVAPAGYGKTTLARQWLAEGDRRYVWYRASHASADVAAFASGVAQALETLIPSAGSTMSDYLRASNAPADEAHVLAELLASELADLPEDALLVIDEYEHAARSAPSDLFVDVLASDSPLRLLILSRRRPTWASARRVVYGEIALVGRDELAMTPDEALQALPHRGTEEASGLARSSRGWPAIIGLAALTTTQTSGEREMTQSLYGFFADDLYRASPPEVQQAVAALSLAPRIDRQLADAMIGPSADAVLASATEAGFLTTSASGELEMHPLLRRFLQDRLNQDEDLRAGAVKRLGRFLLDSARWDDMFEVIRETRAVDLLDDLITHSLRSLLANGRLATLESWIAFAAQNAHESLALVVATAEVAVRSGDNRRARVLASQAIRGLHPHSPLLSRAHLVAARANHLMSEEEHAYADLDQAVQTALMLRDRYDAMWMRYVCACELERPDLQAMLRDFEHLPDDSVDHAIRIESGRTLLRMFQGNLSERVLDPSTVLELGDRVVDPMVRTSFFQFQTWALIVNARYADARVLLDAYLEYVDRTRLRFALPHAQLFRVMVGLGLRQFEDAQMWLGQLSDLGQDDPYFRLALVMMQSRLLLARARFEEAVAITSTPSSKLPARAPYAEYLATRGLALACWGQPSEALGLVDKVNNLTGNLEARVLARWVSAVARLRLGDESDVRSAYELSRSRGAYDPFVCAYRAEPRILHILFRDLSLRDRLVLLVQQAGDQDLLSSPAGKGERPSELESLTRREVEVLNLLAQGKTNKEIAAALFISEVTAKVHVRHILDKLGVRSRTEAAIIALARP